ncbi:MAG TPA: CatA-like O-acetyltransferase [Acidobacteriaceae bacterium]|jgi:chloramphenicol O-acetyltransferase type A
MENAFDTEAVQVDLSTWERRSIFELFNAYSEPYHGVCLRVDCTETFRYAKTHRISVFLSLLHRSLLAANQTENFKTRVVDGAVWAYKTIHGGSAVGRPNGTIGFAHYAYRPHLMEFAREASLALERVKNRTDLERYPGQNIIRYSVLPWFDFTSISHARDFAASDSAPKITFGKITEANGRWTMPVSIHVHHGLADGSHVAEFLEHFEHALATPDAL